MELALLAAGGNFSFFEKFYGEVWNFRQLFYIVIVPSEKEAVFPVRFVESKLMPEHSQCVLAEIMGICNIKYAVRFHCVRAGSKNTQKRAVDIPVVRLGEVI
jgi:hypothetical protein